MILSDNTKIIKNSGILYVRLLITTAVGLLSTRLLLKALGVDDYGIYAVVGGLVTLMGLLNTVMISTTYRFIAYEMGKNRNDKIQEIVNISLVIHFSLAILLVIFAETIGKYYIYNYLNLADGKLDDALFIFRFSIWGSFFAIISIPYKGLITAYEKFSVRAMIEILRSLLRLAAVFIVIEYLGNRLKLYSALMFIVMLIPPLLFFLYCNTKYKSTIRWKFSKNWKKYKEMFTFSVWILLGVSESIGRSQGAALIINSFFGTILNASFGISNQISVLISMFSKNLSQAAFPQVIKNFSSGETSRSSFIAISISKYSFFLMFLPALPILLNINYILKIWLSEVPEFTAIFVKLGVIYALIETMSAGVPALIHASAKLKWFTITSIIIFLISLPTAYLLFKSGKPPYSILIVFIIGLVFTTIINLFLLKKLLNFNIKSLIIDSYMRIIMVVLVLLPLFYLRSLFPDGMVIFIISSIVAVILFAITTFFIGMKSNEREIIKLKLKQLKRS